MTSACSTSRVSASIKTQLVLQKFQLQGDRLRLVLQKFQSQRRRDAEAAIDCPSVSKKKLSWDAISRDRLDPLRLCVSAIQLFWSTNEP